MKKVYLIHGWGGNDSNEGWFGWLKKQLRDQAQVISFNMPNTETPKIKEWVPFLEKNIRDINEETYFVGHSIGCQTILRFFEKLPKNTKVGGAVFVAGWFNLKGLNEEEKETARQWIETPINLDKVKEHSKNFLAVFSKDDPCVPLSDSELFKKKLDAEIVIKSNEGHFDETEKIPEIVDFIKWQ